MEKLLIRICVICCFALVGSGTSAYAYKVEKRLEELSKEEQDSRESALAFIERPTVTYSSERLRDPFVPLIVGGDKQGDDEGADSGPTLDEFQKKLSLTGLVWGGKFPQAIINNQVVKVGDMVGEAKILDIKKEGVTLYYKSNNFKLTSPAFEEAKKFSKKGGINE